MELTTSRTSRKPISKGKERKGKEKKKLLNGIQGEKKKRKKEKEK